MGVEYFIFCITFFWPYLIGFLFFFLRNKSLEKKKTKSQDPDIEDAQIIEEEKFK